MSDGAAGGSPGAERADAHGRATDRELLARVLVWGVASGLVGAVLLAGQIALRTPAELLLAPQPALRLLQLVSVGILLSLAAVALPALALRVSILRRGFPRQAFALVRALALFAAVAPAVSTWVLFGWWNGRTHLALLVTWPLALVATIAAALAFGTRSGSWDRRRGRGAVAAAALVAVLAVAGRVALPTALPFPGDPPPPPEPPAETAGPAAALPPLRPIPPGAPRAVVLLTIDTLRADHLGAYGYPRPTSPAIDRLAAEGVLYERMIAASSGSLPSTASLLTGRYPISHGVRHNFSRLETDEPMLAELFRAHGYRTFAVVSNPLFRAGSTLFRGFDESTIFEESDSAEVLAGVDELLPRFEREPFFAWVHFYEPHTPYEPGRELYERFLSDPLYSDRRLTPIEYGSHGGVKIWRVLGTRRLAPDAVMEEGYVVARYDGEIRAVDRAVAELVERLEPWARQGELVLMLAADHGETMVRSRWDAYFQHAYETYQSSVHVPALLWAPGRIAAGRRVARLTGHVDVPPTLLAAAGLDAAPARRDGAAVLDDRAAGAPAGEVPHYVTQTAWWDTVSLMLLNQQARYPDYAVVHGDWKLIVHPRSDLEHLRGPRSWLYAWRSTVARYWRADELYHLASDQEERRNLIDDEPERAEALRALLAGHLKERPEGAGPAPAAARGGRAGD